MLCETRVLLIDEPLAGLDEEHVDPLIDVFATVAKHSIVLLATHDLYAFDNQEGQALVLHAGHFAGLTPIVAEDGEPLAKRYSDCLEKARIEEVAK